MRVEIDISVFIGTESAAGMVSGSIDLAVLPRVGETISFISPPKSAPYPAAFGLNSQLKVENIIHTAGTQIILVLLADIVLPSAESVEAVASYLEQGFGLFYEPHEESTSNNSFKADA
jgi:hypothetical protein